MKTEFRAGFTAWTLDIEDYKGIKVLSESGNGWTARWETLSAGTHAVTECYLFVNDITFNDDRYGDYDSGSLSMSAVSAHEWGHAFGLGHVGDEDSDSGLPTMSTCSGSDGDPERATLSNDDEGAIHVSNESVSIGGNSFWTVTANSSFEESESSGLEYWRTQNLNKFYRSSSGGGVDGSTYFAYTRAVPGVTNGAILQDTFLTSDNGEDYRGRINYKKHLSSDTGTVKVTIKVLSGTHSSSGCGGLNSNTMGSAWVQKTATCYPSNNWGYCTTAELTVRDGADNRVHEARIVFYNRMQNNIDGGTNTYVRTDRDRAMSDGLSNP